MFSLNEKYKDILYSLSVMIISSIVITGVLMGIVHVLYVIFEEKDYKPDSTWVTSIGTLTDGGNESSGGNMYYNYNNTYYKGGSYVDVDLEGMGAGEKYYIRVNPKKPEKYVVIDWKPLFLEDETRATVYGKIEKIRIHGSDKEVTIDSISFVNVLYTYIVDNESYEHGQWLPPNYKSIVPNLQNGQMFEVEYLTSNPQRSIIHLDKPMR